MFSVKEVFEHTHGQLPSVLDNVSDNVSYCELLNVK